MTDYADLKTKLRGNAGWDECIAAVAAIELLEAEHKILMATIDRVTTERNEWKALAEKAEIFWNGNQPQNLDTKQDR